MKERYSGDELSKNSHEDIGSASDDGHTIKKKLCSRWRKDDNTTERNQTEGFINNNHLNMMTIIIFKENRKDSKE